MSDSQKLSGLVARLAGVKVLVVGDAMLDHYVVGSVSRISPEAPVPILRAVKEFDRVGGAANVGANISALSGEARVACLAGFDVGGRLDSDGERLREKCEALGFAPEFFPGLERTIRKTRFMAARQQMLRVDWEGDCGCPDCGGAFDCARLAELVDWCDVILVSDYAKGMITADVMKCVVASGKPVVVDPRPVNAALYCGATVITPNRKEASEIVGPAKCGNMNGEEMGRSISERLECDVLVTLGEDGMCLVRRDGFVESISTRARDVFDVTGAGDTVAAVLALGIGAGLDLPEAAHLANVAAGVVVARTGTASVTPDELRSAINEL